MHESFRAGAVYISSVSTHIIIGNKGILEITPSVLIEKLVIQWQQCVHQDEIAVSSSNVLCSLSRAAAQFLTAKRNNRNTSNPQK